jgi:hypothetical protein
MLACGPAAYDVFLQWQLLLLLVLGQHTAAHTNVSFDTLRL